MSKPTNLYRVINLDSKAEAVHIRKARRQCLKFLHPQNGVVDEEAKDKREIVEMVCNILLDTDKRMIYDKLCRDKNKNIDMTNSNIGPTLIKRVCDFVNEYKPNTKKECTIKIPDDMSTLVHEAFKHMKEYQRLHQMKLDVKRFTRSF